MDCLSLRRSFDLFLGLPTMSMPISADKAARARRSRFERAFEPILARDEFSDDEVVEHCREESAQFVRHFLKQLTQDCVLLSIREKKRVQYRWIEDRHSFSWSSWIDRQVFGKQLTQTPIDERPRERLLKLGAEQLRTAELLAILIRTGRPGESALDAGERLANRTADQLHLLRQYSPSEMKEISSAVSESAYCQIMAGIELGRRIATSIDDDCGLPERIDSSQVAVEYCKKQFARLAQDRSQEEFHIVTLDTKLQPIMHHRITVGTLDASLVAPREVFRPAIRDASAAVLLVHNHPSGDPTPSQQDYQVTDRLEAAGKLLGIQVIDHIVVASSGAVSIRDRAR